MTRGASAGICVADLDGDAAPVTASTAKPAALADAAAAFEAAASVAGTAAAVQSDGDPLSEALHFLALESEVAALHAAQSAGEGDAVAAAEARRRAEAAQSDAAQAMLVPPQQGDRKQGDRKQGDRKQGDRRQEAEAA